MRQSLAVQLGTFSFVLHLSTAVNTPPAHTLQLPYEEVRTRIVRRNLTPAITRAAGASVVQSELLERRIDLSKDPRPLINALMRKSKSTIKQSESLIVEVDMDRLDLQQPAGILAGYQFVFRGRPIDNTTELDFLLKATVHKQICGLAQPWVAGKVRSEIETALKKQANAFVRAVLEDNAE